jgi:hypothetical protein
LDSTHADTDWTVVGRHKRGKGKLPAPVICKGVALSADQADKRKVILWARKLPSTREAWSSLQERPDDTASLVIKIRVMRAASTRLELICSSPEARETVYESLKLLCLEGCQKARVTRGREWAARPTFSTGAALPDGRVRSVRTKGHSFPLVLCTLNMNGQTALMHTWSHVLSDCGIDILGLCETYHSKFSPSCRGYQFLGRAMRGGFKRGVSVPVDSHGVGFFVRNEVMPTVRPHSRQAKFADCYWLRIVPVAFSKPFMTACDGRRRHTVTQHLQETWIGMYYLSPRLSNDEIDTVMAEISDYVARAKEKGALCIVMGDLNCSVKGTPTRTRTRDNIVSYMCRDTGLRSVHVRSGKPVLTVHQQGVGRTMRDYILVPRSSLKQFSPPTVLSKWDNGSDHWALSVRWKACVFQSSRLHAPAPVKSPPILVNPGWHTSRLTDGSTVQQPEADSASSSNYYAVLTDSSPHHQ